jgi:hypothetical protein
MNKSFYILPFALFAAACQSNSYKSYGEQPMVDDQMLMSVPASDRDDINKARTERNEAVDAVAMAEREVERAQERVNIAKHDIDIAAEEIDAAQARLDLAMSGNGSDRQDRIDDSMAACDGAHAHAAWAHAQVELEKGRVEQAEARVAIAKQRVELADARIELAKAEAVHSLKRPDLEPVDVAQFERAVADEEVELKLTEIDAEACKEKLDVRQDALESRAKSVPASYRKEPMPVKDEPKS